MYMKWSSMRDYTFAAVQIKYLLFWIFTLRTLVVVYQRFGNCEILTKLRKYTVTCFIEYSVMNNTNVNINPPPSPQKNMPKREVLLSLMYVTSRLGVILEMTTVLPLLLGLKETSLPLLAGVTSNVTLTAELAKSRQQIRMFLKAVWPIFVVILSGLCIHIICTIWLVVAYH